MLGVSFFSLRFFLFRKRFLNNRGSQMFNISGAKQYGLNVRRVAQNVFGDEDEGDDDGMEGQEMGKKGQDLVKAQLEMQRKRVELQAKESEKQLRAADPTLVEYDEVYEDLKKQDAKYQEKKQLKQSIRGEPKYIEKLIREAEVRKHQNDLWYEKQLQRQEEAERKVFGETEKFVTPAYKKHLEELKAFEKRQEEEERNNAATSQGMQGFMANLLGMGNSTSVRSTTTTTSNPVAPPTEDQSPLPPDPKKMKKSEGGDDDDVVVSVTSAIASAEPAEKKHKSLIDLSNPLGVNLNQEQLRQQEMEQLNKSKLTLDAIEAAKQRRMERLKQQQSNKQ